MATTHTQTIAMAWGTYIDGATIGERGGLTYMELRDNQYPLIKFNNDAFYGIIVSATLNLYVAQNIVGSMGFNAYRVIRTANIHATWYNATESTSWAAEGGADATDHSFTVMATCSGMSLGWNAISIANLTELKAVIDGQDLIVLRDNGNPYDSNKIDKSNAPYLSITYRTSLLGGVQIF